MSDTVEFLLTFVIAVGTFFVVGAFFAYLGYTQKPKSRGMITLAGVCVALAFLAGIGTILFFTMVPEEVRDRPRTTPANSVDDYHREVNDRLGRIAVALERMTPLLLSPQISNSEWQDQVTTQAAVIQLEYEVLGRMSPPSEALQSHRALLSAVGDCDSSMDRLMAGIDKLDTEALVKANELMESCNRRLGELN